MEKGSPGLEGVANEGLLLNYNRINSGGITRNHCGRPAVPPEGGVVQISIVQTLKEVEEEGRWSLQSDPLVWNQPSAPVCSGDCVASLGSNLLLKPPESWDSMAAQLQPS